MVPSVGGAESEFTSVTSSRIDNTVVIVENFIHGDGYGHVGIREVGIALVGFVLQRGIMT